MPSPWTNWDETTIIFDANEAGELPQGWKRDFVIHTVGWVKDGDLNTATGQTVEPLPFHGMSKYPYGGEESYPSDWEHSLYQKKYNTRMVDTKYFRRLMINSTVENEWKVHENLYNSDIHAGNISFACLQGKFHQ